jgi:hypothetical protein
MAASHVEPSLHSPSLMQVYALHGALSIFAARAMPQATGKPWPRDPVVQSTPGVLDRSGCPCSLLPSLRKLSNSETGKYPAKQRAAYRPGAAWPLLRTNLSRRHHPGLAGSRVSQRPYKRVRISTQLMTAP